MDYDNIVRFLNILMICIALLTGIKLEIERAIVANKRFIIRQTEVLKWQ